MLYCDRCAEARLLPVGKKRTTATCHLCKATLECSDRPNMVELLKAVKPALDILWKQGFIHNEAKGMPVHATHATLDSEDRPMLELRATREIEVPEYVDGVKIRLMVCDPYYH